MCDSFVKFALHSKCGGESTLKNVDFDEQSGAKLESDLSKGGNPAFSTNSLEILKEIVSKLPNPNRFVLKPKLKTFNGNLEEAIPWFRHLREIASYYEWNEEDIVRNARISLTESAKLWYEQTFRSISTEEWRNCSLDPFPTYQIFTEEFLKEFRPKFFVFYMKQKLENITKKSSETYTGYYRRILNMIRDIDSKIEECDIVYYLTRGINSDRRKMTFIVADSLQKWEELSRKLDNSDLLFSINKFENVPESDEINTEERVYPAKCKKSVYPARHRGMNRVDPANCDRSEKCIHPARQIGMNWLNPADETSAHEPLIIPIKVNGINLKGIVDTGSVYSYINGEKAKLIKGKWLSWTRPKIIALDNREIKPRCLVENVKFEYGGKTAKLSIGVITKLKYDLILGMDLLSKMQLIIDSSQRKVMCSTPQKTSPKLQKKPKRRKRNSFIPRVVNDCLHTKPQETGPKLADKPPDNSESAKQKFIKTKEEGIENANQNETQCTVLLNEDKLSDEEISHLIRHEKGMKVMEKTREFLQNLYKHSDHG